MASVLSLSFAIFVSVLLFIVDLETTEIPGRIAPLTMWIITILYLLNPFRWFTVESYHVFWRVLCAPFSRVHFGDFWLANNLNSAVVIFLDFDMFLCPLDNGRVCNDNGYAVRPIISCLPAFWQLMQCSRCYHDTKNYVYLIDAVKASTTFPVVICLLYLLKIILA